MAKAAAKLGLDALLERQPRQLSGGQRQRVAMGRAIVREPKVFLFDEPLSNLDARLREQMRAEIKKLHRDLGATSIYVTHDQIEAMTMADRIVVMHDGVVQQVGTPLELYDRPANIFVAGFIGSPAMNFLDATARAEGASWRSSRRRSQSRGRAAGRPRRRRAGDGRVPGRSGCHFEAQGAAARVDLIEPTGLGTVVHLLVGGQDLKLFTTERPKLDAGRHCSPHHRTVRHTLVRQGEWRQTAHAH